MSWKLALSDAIVHKKSFLIFLKSKEMAAAAACCPPQSHVSISAAEAGATKPLMGRDLELAEKTRVYVIGPEKDEDIKGVVIVFHDIFGFNSGRTHHMCDDVAVASGYLVVAGDFFGESVITEPNELASFSFFSKATKLLGRSGTDFSYVEGRLTRVIVPYIRSRTK